MKQRFIAWLQRRQQCHRQPHLLLGTLCVLFALLMGGCREARRPPLPTPELDILVPTATALTARIEVVVVIVTPTPQPSADNNSADGETPPADATAANDTADDNTESSATGAGDTESGNTESADATSSESATSSQELIDTGEDVYSRNCASCHGNDGTGNREYPALNQSALLTGDDPTQSIQLVLYGRGEMPAFEDDLSNRQIAAVLSYERNSWENSASTVTVNQVRRVRQGGNATAADDPSASAPAADASNAGNESAGTEMGSSPTPSDAGNDTQTPTETATARSTTVPTETADEAPTSAVTATPTVTEATTISASPTETTATAASTSIMTATMTATMTAITTAVTPSLTWTPDRQVTPLLPGDANAPTTPTPAEATQPTSTAEPDTEGTATATAAPDEAASGSADGADSVDAEALIARGEEVYARECASCHQLSGTGTTTYPALDGSELLTQEDGAAAITIVLYGRGEMPAFADLLSNEEIAAVLSYERNSWGNEASPVSPAAVAAERNGSPSTESEGE